jgi:hypothetical protein
MKIMHHIVTNWDIQKAKTLQKECGLIVPSEGYKSIQVTEDVSYFKAKKFFDKWNVLDIPYTTFSTKEISSSKFNRISSTWINGYPQPEEKYIEECYDLSKHCNKCNLGAKQIAPFWIKSEPKWGKKTSFNLNWIGSDILFVNTQLYLEVFEPLGIKGVAPKVGRNKLDSNKCVQLIIPNSTSPMSSLEHRKNICSKCNQIIHDPINEGFLPSFKDKISGTSLVKTIETFGGEDNSYQLIIADSLLVSKLRDTKSNFRYHPLENELIQ